LLLSPGRCDLTGILISLAPLLQSSCRMVETLKEGARIERGRPASAVRSTLCVRSALAWSCWWGRSDGERLPRIGGRLPGLTAIMC